MIQVAVVPVFACFSLVSYQPCCEMMSKINAGDSFSWLLSREVCSNCLDH
jgi:hypothetical protein